jgi:hypothetical protein
MTTLAEENDFNAGVRKAWLHDRKSSGVLEEVRVGQLGHHVSRSLTHFPHMYHYISQNYSSLRYLQHTDEQIVMVGRGLMESRKKMFEGLGKGMTKALQTVAKAAAGVPVGSTQ